MKDKKNNQWSPLQKGRDLIFRPWMILSLILMAIGFPAFGKMVFQIVPTVSISEEYSDNYLQESTDKQEEFVSSYAAGLVLSLSDVKTQVVLSYTPTYRDYKNLDERDGIDHIITLDAQFSPAKTTELTARVNYDGRSEDYQGESRERSASFSGKTAAGKQTELTYGHSISRNFEEQVRTGIYKEHTVNTSQVGLSHRYGEKDVVRAGFTYESDAYATADADEYKKLSPSFTASYWFSPIHGMEAGLEYERTDFDQAVNGLDTEDEDTTSGQLRYIRSFSKHLDGYVKYRHTYTDSQAYTHHIYHPSVGVDWDISEDSGISVGLGLLVHDRSDEEGISKEPFIDLDAFKRFEFSPRTSLTFTGSSDYTSSGEDAASLGYQTSYQVGAALNHQLFRRVGSSIFGAYSRVEYDDPLASRQDNLATFGAGLTWTPLKWLRLGLSYSFTDYNTTDDIRGDYRDNRVYFNVNLVPEIPIRPEREMSRKEFEDQVFSRNVSEIR